MSKKNNIEYWKSREKQRKEAQLKNIKNIKYELQQEYNVALREIENNIARLYSKFSEDNKINYNQAKKLLTGKDYKFWRMDIASYIKKIEKTGDERLLLELNVLAMRSRISRLEELFYQVNKNINNVYLFQHKKVEELLKASIKENYYATIYDVQKYIGTGTTFSKLDNSVIKNILSFPWAGKNYSESIWSNRDKLKDILKTEMTQMFIRGEGNTAVAKKISDRLNTSFKFAMSLVKTENNYIANEASRRGYEETNVDMYQYLANLADNTCSDCAELDLQEFPIADAVVGENFPPMHTNCNCTTIPAQVREGATRAARIGNGKTYEVPATMNFKEWAELNNIDIK
ncbi:TPA: minor capsid protein [Clostridioides difficile]|uniref:minor capsid protein n=1 Tax=Clostridioides difficile TaxID=1496 RepID=UPI001C2901D5|nr:minor capsid protein [Clostridioides difficile]HBH3858543.1 minor capsid protein [Clostridioides difficile]HCU2997090.1 minor capsid protein [Clostridioides difficile]HDZ5431145.1 minor capsid protein [Clostridioides difficile]HEH6903404.1 minor capsid protein [Clostridioides difficile]HEH6926578.1 minor capsid protein [Clostridioides difficile]